SGPRAWISRASVSLPVPAAPTSSTGACSGPARRTCSSTRRTNGSRLPRKSPASCCRRRWRRATTASGRGGAGAGSAAGRGLGRGKAGQLLPGPVDEQQVTLPVEEEERLGARLEEGPPAEVFGLWIFDWRFWIERLAHGCTRSGCGG